MIEEFSNPSLPPQHRKMSGAVGGVMSTTVGPLLMPAFAGMTKNLGLQRVTSGQRKNSTFASRNQTLLGGAAEIGPLMPKTAS
jgi:hypothetical protein